MFPKNISLLLLGTDLKWNNISHINCPFILGYLLCLEFEQTVLGYKVHLI